MGKFSKFLFKFTMIVTALFGIYYLIRNLLAKKEEDPEETFGEEPSEKKMGPRNRSYVTINIADAKDNE